MVSRSQDRGTSSRIIQALERWESETEDAIEPRTIPIYPHVHQGEFEDLREEDLSQEESDQAEVKSGLSRERIWRADGAHQAGPASQPYFPRSPSPWQPSGEERAFQHHLYVLHAAFGQAVRQVVDVLLLNLGWKYHEQGGVSLHLFDPAADCGLAVAVMTGLAEKSSSPLLLIDADLKETRLTRRVGLRPKEGFVDFLQRGYDPRFEQTTGWVNLRFLPGRTLEAGLPAWVDCRRFLVECRKRYALTVVVHPLRESALLPKLLAAADDLWLWTVAGRTSQKTVLRIKELAGAASCAIAGAMLVEDAAQARR